MVTVTQERKVGAETELQSTTDNSIAEPAEETADPAFIRAAVQAVVRTSKAAEDAASLTWRHTLDPSSHPRVIALVNQKGGCGKTTTAVNLSACLALQSRRTLLVDLDPQANATASVGVDPALLDRTIYHVLTEGDHEEALRLGDIITTLASRGFDSSLRLSTSPQRNWNWPRALAARTRCARS